MRVCVNFTGSPKVRAKKKPREGLLRQEKRFGLLGAVEHLLKPFGLVVHAFHFFQALNALDFVLKYFCAAATLSHVRNFVCFQISE